MKRDIQNIDDDIIRKKRLIEKILYTDEDIVEILANPNIDPSVPEDIIGKNVFSFLRVPGVQDVSKNFITFTIDDVSRMPNNKVMKSQYVQFVIFVHKTMVETKYGVDRHDLLGLMKWPLYVVIHIENPLNCSKPLRVLLPQHNWKQ